MSNQGEFRDVMKLVLEEKLNPVIDKVFPLEQIKQAAQYLNDGKQFGKILLKVS
jgi:NADPH:quinone reductase-like Zn-dependent oxidoreductase